MISVAAHVCLPARDVRTGDHYLPVTETPDEGPQQ